jgi:FMN phosphatase YigB (HAD superfamily)
MTSRIRPTRPVTDPCQFTFTATTELLSLDVFGVALDRLVLDPLDVHRLVAAHPILAGVPAYPRLRLDAEHRAKERARRQGRAIIGLAEIADELIELFAPPRGDACALARRAIEIEITLERQLCRPNPQAAVLVAEARRRNVPVAFLSDTYLPRDLVTALLRSVGLPTDLVLVSSHDGATMRDGQLFQLLSERTGIRTDRITHLCRPTPANPASLAGPAGPRMQVLPDDDRLAALSCGLGPPTPLDSIALSLAGRRLAARCSGYERGPTDIGFYAGGPMAVGFAHWVGSQINDQRPDLVLFAGPSGPLVSGLLRLFRPDLPADRLVVAPVEETAGAGSLVTSLASRRGGSHRADRILVIDLGWGGQGHRRLERELALHHHRPLVSAAYLGLTEPPGRREAVRWWAFGPDPDDRAGQLARRWPDRLASLLGGPSSPATRTDRQLAQGIEQYGAEFVTWPSRMPGPLSAALAGPALRLIERPTPAESEALWSGGEPPSEPATNEETGGHTNPLPRSPIGVARIWATGWKERGVRTEGRRFPLSRRPQRQSRPPGSGR